MKFLIFLGFLSLLAAASALPAVNNDYNDDHAEELENAFQGDMIITQEELDKYNGRIDDTLRWPDKIVPYWINMTFFNEDQAAYIHKAAQVINDLNCLTLVNHTDESDYIQMSGASTGCSSSVGRRGGRQTISLAPNSIEVGCFRLYTIVHEFLHAFGFHHMQSSHDRDEYVQIVWENIQAGTENNFALYGTNSISHFGVPYDYRSVMHYSSLAFSINGQRTIVPLQDLGGLTIGQRQYLSSRDILRIRRMYDCAVPLDG